MSTRLMECGKCGAIDFMIEVDEYEVAHVVCRNCNRTHPLFEAVIDDGK